jgi:transposase
MIRIDAAWLATAPLDMRAGTDSALAHDGIGIWLAARRLHQGKFVWASDCVTHCGLERVQLDALVLGLPWQRVGQAGVITVV